MYTAEDFVNFYLVTRFANATIKLSVSAIQTFMWLYMVSVYVETPVETRRQRLPYLCASLVILALYSASSVTFAVAVYHMLFEALPGPENAEAAVTTLLKYDDLMGVSSLLVDLALRVADGVLLYRCYIIWFDRRWILVLPVLVFLTSIAINLRSYIPFSFNDPKVNAIDVFILVGLNVLLTSFITFRLVQAQRQLASALPDTTNKVYLGVIGILVESAAAVALLGIAFSIARLYENYTTRGYQAALVFQILFVNIAILAPQLIIFRVATGTSWGEKSGSSAMFSRPIAFVTPPTETRCDLDEESGTEASDR